MRSSTQGAKALRQEISRDKDSAINDYFRARLDDLIKRTENMDKREEAEK